MINNQRNQYVVRWCVALSIAWILFACNSCKRVCAEAAPAYIEAQASFDRVEQAYQSTSWINKHNPLTPGDPADTLKNPFWTLQNPTWITFFRFFGMLIVIPLVCLAGKAIAEAHFDAEAGRVASREASSMAALEARETLTESEKDITSQLGKIDVNIRVLEVTADAEKRASALINITSALTKMREIMHSSEACGSIRCNPEIRAHALLSSEHLTRIGLAGDRCNLDLIQLFILNLAEDASTLPMPK